VPDSVAACDSGGAIGRGLDGKELVSDTLQTRPDDSAENDALISLVYSSAASAPFDEMDLALLLATSRMNNEARGLTGQLLFRDGQFMQALEGPASAVRAVFRTIAADPRHTGVWTLDERAIPDRRFGSWAMGYRALSDADVAAAPTWFGSPEALSNRDASRAEELLTWFRGR
jgi:hypothetical protein